MLRLAEAARQEEEDRLRHARADMEKYLEAVAEQQAAKEVSRGGVLVFQCHRLHACYVSEVPVPWWVRSGSAADNVSCRLPRWTWTMMAR